MSLTKICFNCKETLDSDAKRCAYCGVNVRGYAENFQLFLFLGIITIGIFSGLLISVFIAMGGLILLQNITKYLLFAGFSLIIVLGVLSAYKRH